MIRITCLGAAGSVTGSCFLVRTDTGGSLLVDCGLFQGGKTIESRNRMEWGFDPRSVPALLLTHAHIDHSGRIPKLVKDGFRGRIIATEPTVDLCSIMLLDAAHVQEMEAEWQTRKNKRQGGEDMRPLYTIRDAGECLRYLEAVERDRLIEIEPGIRARFRNAGHILGSSIVELFVEDGGKEVTIVFSGDLGSTHQLIVTDPEKVSAADYLFVESTYGNRLHRSFEESKEELLDAIMYAVSQGEKVIIPAFALERTQEVLYLLGEFHRDGRLPDVPIYLDSPLAIKATEIFRKHKKYYDAEARAIVEKGFDPFDMPNLHFTETTEESIAINRKRGPAIVIAANGMCTAGRIRHHLKHNLWRPGAGIIIVGFQAEGTTGRQIVDGAKHVRLFGEDVAVKARVSTIGGFSAHADQAGLLTWVGNFAGRARRVFVVHGEPASSEALALEIRKRFSLETCIPRWRETLVIEPGLIRTEELPGVAAADLRPQVNQYILSIEKELDRLREKAGRKQEGERFRDEDVELLKRIREEMESVELS